MNELSSTFVILAAFTSGIILGLNFRSSVELEFRATSKPLFPIMESRTVFGSIVSQVFWFLVVIVSMVAIAVFIMRLGNAYPLSMQDRYTFVILWLTSVACGKYLRYYYWKKKSRKLR